MRSLCAASFVLIMSGPTFGQNTLRTVAGNGASSFSGDGSPAISAQLNRQVEVSGGGGFRATSGG